jgi:uncharacterized protein (DUF697 family)
MTQRIETQPIQTVVNRNDIYEEQSANTIKKYTLASAAAGLIPVTGIDILGSAAAQLFMIRELAQLYSVDTEDLTQTAIYSAMGSAIAKLGTNLVVSVLPGGGSNVAGAAVAGIYTATVGEFYRIHFRDGGTLEDVNIGDFANYFVEEVQRGDINMSTFTNPTALLSHLS